MVDISLKMNMEFKPEFEDTESDEFKKLAKNIEETVSKFIF